MVSPTVRILGSWRSLLHSTVGLAVERPLELLRGVGRRLVLVDLGPYSGLYQISVLFWGAVARIGRHCALREGLVVHAALRFWGIFIHGLDHRFRGLVLKDIVAKLNTLVGWSFRDGAVVRVILLLVLIQNVFNQALLLLIQVIFKHSLSLDRVLVFTYNAL